MGLKVRYHCHLKLHELPAEFHEHLPFTSKVSDGHTDSMVIL
jgi:hypothetical protein